MINNNNAIEKLKMKIAIFNAEKDIMKEKSTSKNKINLIKKKIIMAACACLVLVSGIVLAQNVKRHKNELTMEFVNIEDIESNQIELSLEELNVSDYNLISYISVKFGDKMKDKININELAHIELIDFVIRDEENRIIYVSNSSILEEYCKENNLGCDYILSENDPTDHSLDSYIDREENGLVNIYHKANMGSKIPKSKKLYYSIGKLRFNVIKINEMRNIYYELEGDWNFEIDVEMYNKMRIKNMENVYNTIKNNIMPLINRITNIFVLLTKADLS